MRILLMDVNCKYSSTGKIVYDLYTQLNANGHTAAIAYGRGELVREKDIYRFSPKWEVYLHALFTRITGYTGCFSPIATRRLYKIIDEFSPDVIHLNDMHGYFVNIIPLVRYMRKREIKTVWTFHCEFMYTGKCGYAFECEKWKSECADCPQLNEYPQSLFFDRTHKMYMDKKRELSDFKSLVIVTPSEWLAERVRQSFFEGTRVEVVYNGVNTSVFRRRNTEKIYETLTKRARGKRIILAVAPDLISERKGGRFVIQLAKKMREQPIVFVLIGVRKEKEDFPDNVISLGVIKDQDLLAKYYSGADLFLICSKKETFSMTVAEALCCGTPVIGFKAGAPETIAIEHYSKFVDYGDMGALENVAQEMLENEFDRDKIAKEAQRLYSRERMMQSYLRLYEEML